MRNDASLRKKKTSEANAKQARLKALSEELRKAVVNRGKNKKAGAAGEGAAEEGAAGEEAGNSLKFTSIVVFSGAL